MNMIRQPTLRCVGVICRVDDGLLKASLRRLPRVSCAADLILHDGRGFHLSPFRASSGIKEFIPKWLRRDQEEEIDPEEYLEGSSRDALTATRKPSEKFKADYYPPEDILERMEEICRQLLTPSASSSSFNTLSFPDDRVKFLFLDRCVETFRRRIPSSFVDDVHTVSDAVDFFSRPRLARDRILERMNDGEIPMPKNVHVIPDYMTFEKEMELHEGRDAYPNQDIIVSSLREKGKYKSVRKPKCPLEEAQGFDLPVRYGRHKGF